MLDIEAGLNMLMAPDSWRDLYASTLAKVKAGAISAWLPGSEGAGVADMLFAGEHGLACNGTAGRGCFPSAMA